MIVDVEVVGSVEPIGPVRDGCFGFFPPNFFESRFILLNSQVELLSINVDAEEGSTGLHKNAPRIPLPNLYIHSSSISS
jgi:hypothetical protein